MFMPSSNEKRAEQPLSRPFQQHTKARMQGPHPKRNNLDQIPLGAIGIARGYPSGISYDAITDGADRDLAEERCRGQWKKVANEDARKYHHGR
jgi:hypothetical protein